MQNLSPQQILKYSGIGYLVYTGISVLFGLLAALAIGGTLGAAAGVGGAVVGGAIVVTILLMMIPAAFYVIVALMGMRHAGNPQKAQMIYVLAIVAGALVLLGAILGFSWYSLIGVIVAAAFFYGAYQNKKAAGV